MGFNCIICSESLEKPPGEAPQNSKDLSAAPCGHIFHSYCINKWTKGGLATSNKCPCCRKTIPGSKCIPIFPDSYDESFSQDNGGGGSPEIVTVRTTVNCNHDVELTSLRGQVDSVNNELEEQKRLYLMLGDDYRTLNDKFQNERTASQNYAMKCKTYESYKDVNAQLTKKVSSLKEENAKFTLIADLLAGVQRDVEAEMNEFRIDQKSIKTLLEMKHLLQNDLETTRSNYAACRKENDKLGTQQSASASKIRALERDNLELKSANEDLRARANAFRAYTPPPETSTPIASRRAAKPTPSDHETTIVIDSSDSSFDDEVGIFQPFKVPTNANKLTRKRMGETSNKSSASLKRSRSQSSVVVVSPTAGTSSSAFKGPASNKFLNVRSNVPGLPPISPYGSNIFKGRIAPQKTKTAAK